MDCIEGGVNLGEWVLLVLVWWWWWPRMQTGVHVIGVSGEDGVVVEEVVGEVGGGVAAVVAAAFASTYLRPSSSAAALLSFAVHGFGFFFFLDLSGYL